MSHFLLHIFVINANVKKKTIYCKNKIKKFLHSKRKRKSFSGNQRKMRKNLQNTSPFGHAFKKFAHNIYSGCMARALNHLTTREWIINLSLLSDSETP